VISCTSVCNTSYCLCASLLTSCVYVYTYTRGKKISIIYHSVCSLNTYNIVMLHLFRKGDKKNQISKQMRNTYSNYTQRPPLETFWLFFLFQDAFISPQRRAIKLTRYRMLQGNHLVPPLMGVKGKISCRLYERVMQDKTPAATHQQNRTYYSMSIQ
jgi:hypothetical protein